jgi:hypothetical protein
LLAQALTNFKQIATIEGGTAKHQWLDKQQKHQLPLDLLSKHLLVDRLARAKRMQPRHRTSCQAPWVQGTNSLQEEVKGDFLTKQAE